MAIQTSTNEGYYPMFIRQCECHSYYRDVHYNALQCLHTAYLLAMTPFDAMKK